MAFLVNVSNFQTVSILNRNVRHINRNIIVLCGIGYNIYIYIYIYIYLFIRRKMLRSVDILR